MTATETTQALVALAGDADARLAGADAHTIVAWTATTLSGPVVTSSFGADSAVLLHIVSQVAPQLPVLFLDTGLHFSETIAFRHDLADRLGLQVVDVVPARTVAQQAADHGDRLWETSPATCCDLRKTQPLRWALETYDGWLTGVRRSQTRERASTPIVEARPHNGRWLLKVAPLAAWTDADVDRYLDVHDLPRHPLTARGYRSIGCVPCTQPVAPGADPRAGRWAGTDRNECGIHIDAAGTVVRTTAAGAS